MNAEKSTLSRWFSFSSLVGYVSCLPRRVLTTTGFSTTSWSIGSIVTKEPSQQHPQQSEHPTAEEKMGRLLGMVGVWVVWDGPRLNDFCCVPKLKRIAALKSCLVQKNASKPFFWHPGWVDGEIKTELLGHAPVLMTTARCEIVHGNAMRGRPVYSGCHGTLHSMFLSEESAR